MLYYVLIILLVMNVNVRKAYSGLRGERKHICLEYSSYYNDGQYQADSEHYYYECSLNFFRYIN